MNEMLLRRDLAVKQLIYEAFSASLNREQKSPFEVTRRLPHDAPEEMVLLTERYVNGGCVDDTILKELNALISKRMSEIILEYRTAYSELLEKRENHKYMTKIYFSEHPGEAERYAAEYLSPKTLENIKNKEDENGVFNK